MALTLETALKIHRTIVLTSLVAGCLCGVGAIAEELGAFKGTSSPVSEVAYAKESAGGFNGLVGALSEFGYTKKDRADNRTGVQVEVLAIEPLGGCILSGTKNQGDVLNYFIRSPFPDKRDVYSKIQCGGKPDNMFMEDLADHDGWVREMQFGTSSAYGGQLGDPSAIGLAVDSPATATIRWRWEHKDGSIGPWETKVFRIGPTDGVLAAQ